MNRTKNLQGPCSHCGGMITYPAELIGTVTQCPYCRNSTELLLATPEIEPAIPRRGLFWTIVAIVILIGGLIGAMIGLKRAQNWAAQHRRAPATTNAVTQ